MSEKKIAIVGTGITGLSAGWILKKKGFDVDLFEQHNYAGGSIKSVLQDNWLLEYGPNTLLLRDKKVLDFLYDIGIGKNRIVANPVSSKRYIVKNGELVPVPSSFFEAVSTPLFSMKGKFRILKEPFIHRAENQSDETVADFVKRRLGQEMLDYALNPMIAGIYANKPEKLSMRHTFPAMHDLEQDYGSLVWGAFAGKGDRKRRGRISRELISFTEGLHEIVDTISNQMNDIHYNHKIEHVFQVNSRWAIKSNFGDHGPYDSVILNVPLYKWNQDLLTVNEDELEEIKKVKYPPLSVFHLGFHVNDVAHPLDGFGFLVPEKEDRNILGALFSSTLFPGRAPEDHHLLTVFVGGGRQPDLAEKDSEILLNIVVDELESLIGVRGEPAMTEHVFWPNSIPGYHVGYDRVLETFRSVESRNPGLHLAGNFREGVSVPDCIKNGIALAEQF